MRIFTLVDDLDHPKLKALKKSAERNNVHLDVILSQETIGPDSFGLKLIKTREFIESLHESERVMYVDGFDVLMDGTMEQITDKLSQCIAEYALNPSHFILFSAETNCWPDTSLISAYKEYKNPFRFLCAGCFVGTVSALKPFLDLTDTYVSGTDDQYWWTLHYLKHNRRIQLDHECILFQNLYGSKEYLDYKDGYWFNRITQTRPIIFHGNGSSKDFLFNTIGPAIGLVPLV